MNDETKIRSTTILSVRKDGRVAIAGDGQVTFNDIVMKKEASKIRWLYNEKVLVGFAGATADAFTLFERFESKLEQFSGQLVRSAVELAKDWRTDRSLRRLEALLIAVDKEHSLIISGTGDVIEPDDGLVAIGSGGPYALAAARAMVKHADLSAKVITEEAMLIAADICIYTNENILVEEIK